MSDGAMDRLTMTVDEAADRLGVSSYWLSGAARRGEVPSRKVGRSRRFTESDLAEYLERVKQGQDPWVRSRRSEAQIGRRRKAS